MYQNLNAINQSPNKGEVKAIPNPNTVSCMILGTSTRSPFVAASPVTLVSATGNETIVDLARDTDTIFGFIIYGPKRNKWKPGDRVEVAMSGSVMEMESEAAFNRGQVLEIESAGTKVIAWAGSKAHIGRALDTATGPNQLVRVFISTSIEEGSSSSSSSSSKNFQSSSSSSSRSSSSSSCSSSSSVSSSSSSSSCRSSSSSSRSSSSSSCSSSSSSSRSSSSSSSSRSSSSSSCSSSSSSRSSSSSSSSSSCRSSSSSSSSSFSAA